MNVKVLVDFTAVREDEISVYRGEVIQVSCIVANARNHTRNLPDDSNVLFFVFGGRVALI